MNKILIVIACSLLAAAFLRAEQAPSFATASLETLVAAIVANDYQSFTALGDKDFSEGISADALAGVSSRLAPIFQGGYEVDYLTSLQQQGFKVHVWKLTPKQGSNEFLARLVEKDGKISGFWIQ